MDRHELQQGLIELKKSSLLKFPEKVVLNKVIQKLSKPISNYELSGLESIYSELMQAVEKRKQGDTEV